MVFNEEAITDNIFLVKGKNEGRFPYSHSILILDEDLVLIDTGCGIRILKQLKRKYDVSYVINSHTHPDHSAGNWVFKDRPLYVPEEGLNTSGNVVALSKRFVSRKLTQVWQGFAKKQMKFKDCRPTDSYSRRTVFNFGKTTLQPVYTPGHTKDHYCFIEPRERILFSFDYDLTSFPWYGHRESSIPQFRESVKKLRALSPQVVVSSHRGIITRNIDAEFDKFYRIIDERSERILSLLESEKTIDQLVEFAPIYRNFRYVEPLLRYWEGQMIKKHLKQLKTTQKVRRHRNSYLRIKES